MLTGYLLIFAAYLLGDCNGCERDARHCTKQQSLPQMFNDEDKHDIVALTSEFGSHGIKSQYTLEGEEEGEEEMVGLPFSDNPRFAPNIAMTALSDD